MITLVMDTAYKYLVLGLFKDGVLLAGFAAETFKRQSEEIFVQLQALLEQTGLDYKDIDEVIITDGPGSYTGIRIAMTVAKVLCTQMDIPLYVLSTMQIYAGEDPQANVILDARGHRVYAAHLENGQMEGQEVILDVDALPEWLEKHPGTLYGDAALVQMPEIASDFLHNFINLKPYARRVDNVHALIPRYLKESDAYKV